MYYIVLCKATYNQWPKFPALKNPFSYFWVGIPTYCVHRKEKSYSPNEIPPHTITYIQKNQYCGVAKYYMYATIGVWIEKKENSLSWRIYYNHFLTCFIFKSTLKYLAVTSFKKTKCYHFFSYQTLVVF